MTILIICFSIAVSATFLFGLVQFIKRKSLASPKTSSLKNKPISVNYHFSRKCNYQCGFCFHTAKNSHILSLDEAKRGLDKLKEAGMRKINFAGGEPFLYPDFLGELVRYCKQTLELESVSIISNGSLIKANWMRKYSPDLDILGISCDSFDEQVNIKIGRGTGKQVENIFRVRDWCHEYNVKFKLNTVVCRYNVDEDMNESVARLAPFRWKCFQVLIVKSENDGADNAMRDASRFKISDQEYETFVKRHEEQPALIRETNSLMKSSYLILDENMRFLDKGNDDNYVMSESILDVSVEKALAQINWDVASFEARHGEYDWSKEFSTSGSSSNTSSCSQDKNLDW